MNDENEPNIPGPQTQPVNVPCEGNGPIPASQPGRVSPSERNQGSSNPPQQAFQPAPQYGAYAPAQPPASNTGQPVQQIPEPAGQPKQKWWLRNVTLKVWMLVLSLVGAVCVGIAIVIVIVLCVSGPVNDTATVDSADKTGSSQSDQSPQSDQSNGVEAPKSDTGKTEGTPKQDIQSSKMGETSSNGSLTMKLNATSEPANVPQQWNGTQPDLTPAAGTKFFEADVTVTNNSQKPIDITCSAPLDIKAVNDKNQQYSTIEDLFKIPGNPECNAQLQPGMASDVKYVFNMPSDTKIIALAWEDWTDFNSMPSDYSYFILDDNYHITSK